MHSTKKKMCKPLILLRKYVLATQKAKTCCTSTTRVRSACVGRFFDALQGVLHDKKDVGEYETDIWLL